MQSSSSKFIGLLICPLLVVLSSAAYAQSDVTQPGDPVIASSSNSPGSEGVANAIDNTQAKYLNRDLANDAIPAGFVVSPSVGVTRVIGMTITSANDAPERDPKTFILEGSNDAQVGGWNNSTNTWVFIAGETNIPLFTARFQTQTFSFENFKPYRHYRWTVLATQSDLTGTHNGCCMQIAEVELLGSTLPPDVTQPGDPLVASSSNSPGSEGVANAIDNTQAKYLNRDLANDAIPAGFVVSPSIGNSLVTGMTITSANDAPERDPKTVILEGSNDAAVGGWNNSTNTWTFIAGVTNIPLFTARFQTQTFLFDNFIPYRHYRWTVLATQSDLTGTHNGCCMQIAEVELLGTGAPKDVTQPGDAVIASSSNSPGSEGVANAIDNTQAKYLNRDLANDAVPAGFVVTPSIGGTVVIGMTITSANDAPERDPKTVILEGSNDAALGGWNNPTNTWTFVAGVTNIPLFTARFQTQQFYFRNITSYKSYRWTVLNTQSDLTGTHNGCCMQVAEVELLAATQSNPCGQTAFVDQPVDTPALIGSPATFVATVNGPWTVQWLANGLPIPGANKLSYNTAPMTAAGDTNLYSLAIVGCQTSQVVRATLFTPSATKSIGIHFWGSSANGAGAQGNTDPNRPNHLVPTDIVGVQPQAYWNVATNANGITGDGASLPDALTDSSGTDSTVTFEFTTSGTWGSGTGISTPTQIMLNGIAGAGGPGTDQTMTFHNVPAGTHAVLVYSVEAPLNFKTMSYAIGTQKYYIRVMNSDEYKPAPGFYRGTSTDPNNPSIADFIRFDNVSPDVGGDITLTVDVLTVTGQNNNTGVNGIQLVLNAPAVGAPPTITQHPSPVVGPTNGVVSLTVQATGQNLTYQWRKNGRNLANGGHVSGATTSTLTISSLSSEDAAVYNVAVFNAAGSVVSRNATVNVSAYNINDALVGYWKLDETSGTTAANSVAGGQAGTVNGTATRSTGQVGGALSFDGATTYVVVPDYPKATKALSVSGWVNVDASAVSTMCLVRNAEGPLGVSVAQDGGPASQFELVINADATTGALTLHAGITAGPNHTTIDAPTPFPTGSWHHVGFTADGAQLALYIDGVQVAATPYLADFIIPEVKELSMGARLNLDTTQTPPVLGLDGTTPNNLLGSLDDIGLWNRALTADELNKVYTAGKAGNPLTSVVETPPSQGATLTTAVAGNALTVSWSPAGGRLQKTAALGSGALWTDVGTANPSAPITIGPDSLFLRVVNP